MYVHQMSHIFYVFSMAIFIYWLRERKLIEETGWRYIQYSALFFILWNIDAILVHYISEQTEIIRTQRIDNWHLKIISTPDAKWLKYLFMALKLDHLLCVPAVVYLYFGLKRLLSSDKVKPDAGRIGEIQ